MTIQVRSPLPLWGALMNEGLPIAIKIIEIIRETPTIRTFRFDSEFDFRPGQFVMVWVPGVDEIPMALSAGDSITVARVGDATSALFAMHEGDMLGIRGPFGNGFSISGRTLAVGGGIGASPLLPLAAKGLADTFLLGARTGEELVFRNRLETMLDLRIATDDGSCGHHGFVTHLMKDIDLTSFTHICVCGPEMMMKNVLAILEAGGLMEKSQFSLHRYMKCGIGVCGSCCMDPSGLRVCTDGPVFAGNLLADSPEFGKYTRSASGNKKFY